MSKDPSGKVAPVPGGERSKLRDKLLRVAVYSAPMIAALQAAAFAESKTGVSPGPSQPNIVPIQTTFMGPEGLATLGTVLATVGAYRLMKASKRNRKPEGGEQGK